MFENRREDTFIKGFCCWNDGGRRLDRHDKSAAHNEAMLAFHNSHSTFKVDKLLSKSVLVKKKENHDMLIM